MAANYTSPSGAAQAARGPFSWVPKQMLSGDAADEEGESDGDSDRGDEDRGEGDEAELVIDIPNEWASRRKEEKDDKKRLDFFLLKAKLPLVAIGSITVWLVMIICRLPY